MNTIEAIAARMSEEDKEQLKAVWEPTIVCAPPGHGWAQLCVTPEGEIRCYDYHLREDYVCSADGGLSWKTKKAAPQGTRAFVCSPYSGRYLSVHYLWENGKATTVVRRYEHPDDKAATMEQDLPGSFHNSALPVALKAKKRWILTGDVRNERGHHAGLYYSDDDGDSWSFVEIEPTPYYPQPDPNKVVRWQNYGVEPTVTELNDGRLMMILRTSQDYHYVCYSEDCGETWSKPEPTSFHSTLTKPHLFRMQDGRLLFFYNNTRPLPEQDKSFAFPPLGEDEATGVWEDVFTNRDSNCVTISEDDGKTWKGFRELYLNPLRNTNDFRSSGFYPEDIDKSVHQMQAIELPFGKVLVHVGQHKLLQRLVIFDPGWLYETARCEDFGKGLTNVSTQVYVKSVSGGCNRKFPGHCAWNRTDGALLIPDPAGDRSEVLLLRNTNDPWLVSQVQGLCWNFPAAPSGTLTARVWVHGNGVRLSLLDHWMNPIDTTVPQYAAFTAEITDTKGGWQDIAIRFKGDTATLSVDGAVLATLPKNAVATPNGLCFFHAQTLTETGDTEGTYIKSFAFERE